MMKAFSGENVCTNAGQLICMIDIIIIIIIIIIINHEMFKYTKDYFLTCVR